MLLRAWRSKQWLRSSLGDSLSRSRENGIEHRFREFAREGVLLARMVASDKQAALIVRLYAVTELWKPDAEVFA